MIQARIFVASMWVLCTLVTVSFANENKPNIVVTLADDLGYGDGQPERVERLLETFEELAHGDQTDSRAKTQKTN